jgi:hypothetical protein
MTLMEYIAVNQSKYAVIAASAYDTDEVAQGISSSPRRFTLDTTEYVILSLNPSTISNLVDYISTLGLSVEYEFVKGSGKVSLLTHSEALELLKGTES